MNIVSSTRMKSSAIFLGSALAAGVGAGFLMSLLLAPVQPEAGKVAQFRTSELSVRNLISAVEENAMVRAVENAVVKFAAPAMMARPAGTAVMLLSEPVVVLTPERGGWDRLEAGQQVTLVANQGRFLRVKYADKEVSIPRTAVTQGIASIQ
ncbi:MAG: hypothetical protein ACO1QR_03575 [Chthoniobacteraceae bacterium]